MRYEKRTARHSRTLREHRVTSHHLASTGRHYQLHPMIISCNRIIFPPSIDEEDEVIREAKMKQAAKYIRKRRCCFHLGDVEKISEHEDNRFAVVYFYYSEPFVIEFPYQDLETAFKEINQPEEDGGFLIFNSAS